MNKEDKIFKLDKKEICITSTQIKRAIDLLVDENEILQNRIYELEEENKELNRMCELYSQSLYNADLTNAEKRIEQLVLEIERLNNIINELEKYIHSELVLDFYNDDMPCELIINKMEKMIKELKENK